MKWGGGESGEKPVVAEADARGNRIHGGKMRGLFDRKACSQEKDSFATFCNSPAPPGWQPFILRIAILLKVVHVAVRVRCAGCIVIAPGAVARRPCYRS